MIRWLMLGIALAVGGAAAVAEERVVDGIAAQVGSEIVLVSEVKQVAAPAEARLRAEGGTDADLARLHVEVLERLIERALIRQVVRRAELDATEVDVDQAIAAIASENNITPEQLRQSVEDQGLPFDVYRERIRGEIEQSKVLNGMVASKVRVEESEVRALYDEEFSDQPEGGEEVYVRHILRAFDPQKPETRRRACEQVEAALGRIRAGASFPEVASEVSEANPLRGGDLGWLHMQSLAGWMKDAIQGLEPGGTSGVIETVFGCNLLQLVERRAYQQVHYEQARDVLRAQIFNERMAREYVEFMEDLREQTYIERKGTFAEAARLDVDPLEMPESFDY